jgi:hypothetical protein
MSTLIKIICFAIALLSIPVWALMAGFSPALIGSSALTTAQKLLGGSIIAIILAVPLWMGYFAWRTIKTWRTAGAASAILMILPALAMIGFIAYVNVRGVSP